MNQGNVECDMYTSHMYIHKYIHGYIIYIHILYTCNHILCIHHSYIHTDACPMDCYSALMHLLFGIFFSEASLCRLCWAGTWLCSQADLKLQFFSLALLSMSYQACTFTKQKTLLCATPWVDQEDCASGTRQSQKEKHRTIPPS